MKSGGLLTIFLLVAGMAGAAVFGPDEYRKHQAKKAVANTMSDPDSAQFRGLFVTTLGRVCGEANGRNLYGAYVGYRRFVSNGSRVSVADGVGGYSGVLDPDVACRR